uniref:Uncharacterized protein n=1 Tax=Oryza nivara TaxID=4536 RepID=A0A0E0GXZ2_ORYNI
MTGRSGCPVTARAAAHPSSARKTKTATGLRSTATFARMTAPPLVVHEEDEGEGCAGAFRRRRGEEGAGELPLAPRRQRRLGHAARPLRPLRRCSRRLTTPPPSTVATRAAWTLGPFVSCLGFPVNWRIEAGSPCPSPIDGFELEADGPGDGGCASTRIHMRDNLPHKDFITAVEEQLMGFIDEEVLNPEEKSGNNIFLKHTTPDPHISDGIAVTARSAGH